MGAGDGRRWPIAVLACAAVAGLLFAAAATTSGGSDLRATGGDSASLVRERTEQITRRRTEARRLQAEIDSLTEATRSAPKSRSRRDLPALLAAGGLEAVQGPGMRIELSDAPRQVEFDDVNPNLLVVHQQDIQAFVNALWAGGAEAVSLQGQRLVSTSGIKCVGNTVVIDGVPYSPPYVIEAIGNPLRLRQSLDASPEVTTYRTYARDYQLGLTQADLTTIRMDAYAGPVEFGFARPLGRRS
ncbi:MAG TPA: DUF881 domain-containing protein [Aeromicrobium sp.]|nr:DUF881 domain-containing protein [Aeromicrobium sp.]